MAKQQDCVYGFPCVENPHDFSPDRECCTPEDITFWEDACRRWDAGERDVRGARCETVRNESGEMIAHFTRTSWGVGVNSLTWDQLWPMRQDELCDVSAEEILGRELAP